MKTAKARKIVSLIIMVFLTITTLCGCEKQDPVKKQVLKDLKALAEIEDFDDLSMSVYYFDPLHPIIIDDLGSLDKVIAQSGEYLSFQLHGDEIKGRLDSFSAIEAEDIVFFNNCKPVELRSYTVIESSEEGKIFELIVSAHDFNHFIVNGVGIVRSMRLYKIFAPVIYE
ncbi:MAG TPA: hypothetical protein PK459_01360 [Anaerolineaceae bacterium]|nr:hypothetical protein [Anaerolineaceae bacterium]HQC63726.1 hypothetical protein [Anaerolineaceae bacterium]